MKKTLVLFLALAMVSFFPMPSQAASLEDQLEGRILLQVEDKGEAWYVSPGEKTRYFLGRPADAFAVMRELGVGVSEKDYKSFGEYVPSRLAGKILLRVEANGEAYYVNPLNRKMYFLGRPADAFNVMRGLGLGITNQNLNRIRVSQKSRAATPATPATPAQPQDSQAAIPATPAVPAQPQDSPAAVVPDVIEDNTLGNLPKFSVVYEVAVNDYPDHENYDLSKNIPYAYVNVYTVDPATYKGTLKQIINTGADAAADVVVALNEIVNFVGYKSKSEAQAHLTYEFSSPPYKNFGQVDRLCQINYHVPTQYLQNSVDYACSMSLSTPYQDGSMNEDDSTDNDDGVNDNSSTSSATWGWKKATDVDDVYRFINGLAPYSAPVYVGDIAWSNGAFYVFYRGDKEGTGDWGWKLAQDNGDAWDFLNRKGAYTGLAKKEIKAVTANGYNYIFYRGTESGASWGWKKSTEIGDMYNFINGLSEYPLTYWGDIAGERLDNIVMFYNGTEDGDNGWGWKLAQTTDDAYNFLNRLGAYSTSSGKIYRINVVTDENGWFYIFYNHQED